MIGKILTAVWLTSDRWVFRLFMLITLFYTLWMFTQVTEVRVRVFETWMNSLGM